MIRIRLIRIIGGALLCYPALSLAGPCDAHFAFDGNLNDSGGNGYHGRMFGKEGAVGKEQFADGKIGQSLHLDGSSAMRSFIDLHFDRCPQITISAWIRVESNDVKGDQYLISTGSGAGPGVRVLGNNIILRGSGNGLWQRNALRDKAEWFFVAGVYDYVANTYRLHWRERTMEGKFNASRRPPEDVLWVGAFNDKFAHPAQSAFVDDLRIYGQALTADELAAIQKDGAAAPGAGTPRTADTTDTAALSCAEHSDCPTGNYCAWDNTCHPDSHAPKRKLVVDAIDAGGASCDVVMQTGCGAGEKCTADGCMPDGSVPLGGSCAVRGGLDECAGGTYCSGGACTAFGDAAGSAIISETSESVTSSGDGPLSYEACSDPGCGMAGDSCFDIVVRAEATDGAMCTNSCASNSECASANGFAGACYSLEGSLAVCYQRCDRNSDCNTSTTCVSTTLPGGTLDGICVPDNSP